MRFIAPRTGAEEVTVAEDQEIYKPITVGMYDFSRIFGPDVIGRLIRVTFSLEERKQIVDGRDIYIMQIYSKMAPMTPIDVRVGPGDWKIE